MIRRSKVLILSITALLSLVGFSWASTKPEPSSEVRLSGRFAVERRGGLISYQLLQRDGKITTLQVPPALIDAHNGLRELEGSYLVVQGTYSGSRFKARQLQTVTPDSPLLSDPVLKWGLPSVGEIQAAKTGYRGPVRDLYDAMQAGVVSQKRIASAISPSPRDIDLVASSTQSGPLAARLYIGGNARHYYLISHAALSGRAFSGVTIQEVWEDKTREMPDGNLLDTSLTLLGPDPKRPEWQGGEVFQDSRAGAIKILSTTPAGATVRIRPFQASNADVTNTADSGPGSLRNAMTFHNANPSVQVSFRIPITDSGFVFGVWTIKPAGPLPTLTATGSTLDGVSQRLAIGNTNHIGPEIFIDFVNANSTGLSIGADNCLVRELGFIHATGAGINVSGSINSIQRCFIGIGLDGATAAPNTSGIIVTSGTGNLIGSDLANGNLVSGNSFIGIKVAGGSGTKIEGNKVGTDVTGKVAVPNAVGIALISSNSHHIGSLTGGHGNLVSGNGTGIQIQSANSCTLFGNKIGVKVDSLSALPNQVGVQVTDSSSTIIGGHDTGAFNIISGNQGDGLRISGAGSTGNSVLGNRIGLGAAGVSIGNQGAGISLVAGPTSTQIGSPTPGDGNVISANKVDGVTIDLSNQNRIQGNRIGTTFDGLSEAGNGQAGVNIEEASTGNLVGGAAAGEGNIIGGNYRGVTLFDRASSNTITGNVIGLDTNQAKPVPNFIGVNVDKGVVGTIIGGASGAGNLICGNAGPGIEVAGGSGTLIRGNLIGVTKTGVANPNKGNGVNVLGSSSTTIGGTGYSLANTIAGNTGVGIDIKGSSASTNVLCNYIGVLSDRTTNRPNTFQQILIEGSSRKSIVGAPGSANFIGEFSGIDAIKVTGSQTVGNSLRANSFTAGEGLGINLDAPGDGSTFVTNNDNKDPDVGPNNLQNFPTISTVTYSSGALKCVGNLNSVPSKTFTIDIYAVNASNSVLHGGTMAFVGSKSVTTDTGGNASFSVTFKVAVRPGFVCAMATDINGNSSEFGPNKVL